MGITSSKVTVYDIAGKAIFVKDYNEGVEANKLELDFSNGVYLMQLTDSNTGDVYKQKFIIQKNYLCKGYSHGVEGNKENSLTSFNNQHPT